jgi:hypothetical protein
MGPSDPWEYYMDIKTKKWYTRKKDTAEWIDMEAKLPDVNMQKALDKLNSYVDNIISKPDVNNKGIKVNTGIPGEGYKGFYVDYGGNSYVYYNGKFFSRPNAPIESVETWTPVTDLVLIKNIKEKGKGANMENAPWKKQTIKLKKGDKVKFNPSNAGMGEKLNLYKYNNMGFYKAATYRVEQNPNVVYLGQDRSGVFALVQFDGELKYWINKRFLLK